jgi:lipopolysaccharide export system permease protein
VLFFIIYYIISLTGEKFSRESVLSPFTGMWISSFVLIPLGAFLTYKASKDSVIMNIETYFNFFKKLFKIKTPTE